MMTAGNIIDVSDESFEIEVINYSTQFPVVMDFWAPWCVPCRVQSPILAKLAVEAEGAFRLARVNVDEQIKLAERLKVKNVPAIKAFVDGRMVADYTGVLSEANLRSFIDRILPKTGDLLLEKGKSLILLDDLDEAEKALRQYLLESHGSPGALLAYARVLLLLNRAPEAIVLLKNFPASPEFHIAQQLLPVAKSFINLEPFEAISGYPLESAYRKGLRLARSGKIQIALDGFLDILRKDKNFRDGEVKEVYLGLLEVLSDQHPDVRQYRADLSNVLF